MRGHTSTHDVPTNTFESQTTGAPCPGACRMRGRGGEDLATREVRANQSSHSGQLYYSLSLLQYDEPSLSLSSSSSLSHSLDVAPFAAALCSLIIIIATLRQIPDSSRWINRIHQPRYYRAQLSGSNCVCVCVFLKLCYESANS